MQHKLRAGEYRTVPDFSSDVRLVFSNAVPADMLVILAVVVVFLVRVAGGVAVVVAVVFGNHGVVMFA